ncbi:MAG: hypothetical protein JO281_02000 [Pseudonocardiales bacterium]|nr:hypothetical protein [Pseudonocardiales bacterium]
MPDLRDDESRRWRVARWLAQLYPSGPGYWGALQPELVAETHVIEQLKECPELVMAELSELCIEQKRRMLRVLSMGAAVSRPVWRCWNRCCAPTLSAWCFRRWR